MSDPIDLDAEARGVLGELINARARIAEWETVKRDLEDRLKKILDDALSATIDGRPVLTYAPVTSRVLDQSRLRAEHPDLAAQYLTQRTTRPFRLIENNLGGSS